MKKIFFVIFMIMPICLVAQTFNGLENNMGNLYRLSDAKTRSISPENFTGEKGKGGMADPKDMDKPNVANAGWASRDLGQGWKVNSHIRIAPGETFTIAEMEGPGAVQHIWITSMSMNWRFITLRIYWDDEKEPSVEVPFGDFFCMGWNEYAQLSSLAVCVNPGRAFNCYWTMPFRKKCRITLENLEETETQAVFYQVDYALTEVSEDAAYFHAQYRRSRFTENSVHTLVDGVKGKGHFVGAYLAWGVNNNGWWGEGEFKFYMDGDTKFPTICGTGAEDYICGSHDFAHNDQYVAFSTPYSGLHQVIRPDGYKKSQQRFGMYRWHITDPIRFEKDLRVTVQDMGWRYGGRYLPQASDISSTVFWYQKEPHASFPAYPSREELEVN